MMSYFGVVPNGHALDQPNAVLGIAFYGIALLLPKMKFIPKGVRTLGMWLASCVSCASSAWLGYILVNVLHDICIVCVSTYVVNAIIFFFSTRELLCGSKKSVKAKGD
jgi:vitamin-K-epoxide reductase (warfarin-sensitive)